VVVAAEGGWTMANTGLPLGCRDLTAVDVDQGHSRWSHRPNAAYLAQLLAIKYDLLQMRCRRRATAGDAVATYRERALSDAKLHVHLFLREL
jgi:hypothetical protein